MIDQHQRQHQRELHLVHRIADPLRAVVQHFHVDAGRDLRAELRQQLADLVDHLDRVGAGLALDGEHDAALVVVPGGHAVVLHVVDGPPDVPDPHRRAVAVGHDHVVEGGGVLQLTVGHHRGGTVLVLQRAGGQIRVRPPQRLLDLVDADAPGREGLRVHLHPHRIGLRTEDLHLRHAAHHRDALRHQGLGVLVDAIQRQRVGGDGEVEDRHVRRVDLAVGRRYRHVRGELAASERDRRLHVLSGGVDVAVQRELQGDLGGPLGAGGGHLLHPGDGGELLLQRRGDRRSHRLRAGAGQLGAHLDRREVDVGQLRDRQLAIGHDPEGEDADHDQQGHDRAADEDLGEVHAFRPFTGARRNLAARHNAQLASGHHGLAAPPDPWRRRPGRLRCAPPRRRAARPCRRASPRIHTGPSARSARPGTGRRRRWPAPAT